MSALTPDTERFLQQRFPLAVHKSAVGPVSYLSYLGSKSLRLFQTALIRNVRRNVQRMDIM